MKLLNGFQAEGESRIVVGKIEETDPVWGSVSLIEQGPWLVIKRRAYARYSPQKPGVHLMRHL